MNLLLLGVGVVIGYAIGFVAGVLQVKEVRQTEAIAHNRTIEGKNAEIKRLRNNNNELQKSNNELRQRNKAQIDAFDRITGNNNDYFKAF